MSVGVPQGFAQLHPGRANKRKALLNSRCPLRGHRVYEGKNNNDTHCCFTQGQLCPTWQSYAGLPPGEGACVTYCSVESLGLGSMVAGDFGASLEMTIGLRSGPGLEGSKGSEGVVSPTAMIIKSALRDYLLCFQCCMT